MAHLLEHLVFKGTPTHGDITGELKKRGVNYNGTTYFDRTNYYSSFPANDDTLRWVLGMEADRMVNSFIAKTALDSEMTVVRNEMERGENSPMGILRERVLHRLPLAQLRPQHHRRAQRCGKRADRAPAGLLPPLVPAGHRHADRLRAHRPGRRAAADQCQLRQDPRPTRVLPPMYTVEPTQDGEREVTCAAPATCAW
jgi:zinc protease